MRALLVSVMLVCCTVCLGQSIEVVELGNLMGEMKEFSSALKWTNSQTDSLEISLWSARQELGFVTEKMTVAPGDEVTIPYSIDLEGSIGQQSYEVRVIGREDIILQGFLLKSRVFEVEEDVFRAYRNEFFPFRTPHQVMNLKAGFRGQQLEGNFNLFNFGGADLDLTEVFTNSEQVVVEFEPAIVKHNAFTRLSVSLNSQETDKIGFTREKLVLYRQDSSVLATIPYQFTLEPLPQSDPVMVNSGPHLTLSRLTHDFKVMEVGEKESVSITVTNTGRSVLLIERLEANCDCLEFEMNEREIEQGQSTQLTVSFNAKGRLGYERKTLALFTNDPDQPTRVLTFKAHVK